MGTGTFAGQCLKYFEGVKIEGVEIDEKITNLAEEYFELPDTVEVTTYDGRAYLQASDRKYDVIMVDAYQDITIPFQMSSMEFFTLVKEHLKENGVMVVNMNMQSHKEGNINDYLADTIAAVFPHIYTVDVSGSTNRELFASSNSEMLTVLKQGIAKLGETKTGNATVTASELKTMLHRVSERLIPYEKGGYLLTDDKAPVELLGMKVIDEIIEDEIGYYKEVFKKEGIEGLLNGL